LWVCVIAFMLSDEQSIYREQVATRSQSPAHQGSYARELLANLWVRDFVSADAIPVVRPNDSLAVIARRFAESASPILPLVDEDGRLMGTVELGDVSGFQAESSAAELVVARNVMRPDAHPLAATDRIGEALERFVERHTEVLPVVNNDAERHYVGVIRQTEIGVAALKQLQRFDNDS
jgi:CIC family chloride channel protein